MPRRTLLLEPNHYYHLYNRGNDRHSVFFERENYLHFLRLIRRYLIGETLDLLAYCLMPNHYHLLIYVKSGDLSDAMQSLSLAYTKAMNRRYNRVGTLFQGRFRAIGVDREEYLYHLVRYIHLNPVNAGLVSDPAEWEFSSYLDYVGLRGGRLPKVDRVRQQFASEQDYRLFLTSSDSELPGKAGDLAKVRALMLDE